MKTQLVIIWTTVVGGLEKEKKKVLSCLDSKIEIDVPP